MSIDKLDIEAVRKHLLPAPIATIISTLKQALDELEQARELIKSASCSICKTVNLSPPYCSHKQPCRPVYAKLELARARIAELEKKIPSCFIQLPKHWPPHYNANGDPCDTIDGPCSCGGWHSIYDKWVQNNMERYGLEP